MPRSMRMLSFLVLLTGLITQCTDDEVGSDDGDGGGQPSEGGSAGDAESSGGELPIAGDGSGAIRGTPQGGAGNAGGARPGGAGNGGASGAGDGGAGDGATGNGGDGGATECTPGIQDNGWDPNVTCCWVCDAGEPCRRLKCGNGTVENDCLIPFACYQASPAGGIGGPFHFEECDDGNLVDGDGCSSSCDFETELTCGNGQLDANEVCDDGNREPNDGCDPLCRSKPYSYHCDVPGEPCEKDVCGNGRSGFGLCDDGNTDPGDGCDAECIDEPGFTCPTAGECVEAFCGNGSIDDYLPEDSDGFAGASSVGGQLLHREECDDGNAVSGDGCNSICRIEEDWTCSVPGDDCRRPDCGDGYRFIPGEECDDGNDESGDGCSDACETESGWICTDGNAGSSCTASRCGDGLIDTASGENCDDGNDESDDGCSSECAVEGALCTGLTEE
jgi:cysteine-rich repeat protein